MPTKLFLREYRRAAIAAVVGLAGVGVALYLIEAFAIRSGDLDTFREASDTILVAILSGVAFLAGERSFSRDLKDRHSLFLYSLPVTRGSLWLTLVSAHFLAVVTGALALLLIRPFILVRLLEEGPAPVLVNGAFFLSLFLMGTVLGLVLRHVLAIYLAGAGLWLSTVIWMSLVASYPTTVALWAEDAPPSSAVFLLLMAILIVLLTALSLRFFSRGELSSWPCRLRHGGEFLLGLGLFWLAGWGVAGCQPLYVTLSDGWGRGVLGEGKGKTVFGRIPDGHQFLVPSDGEHLVVWEVLPRFPRFGRVTVVDTETGATIRRLAVEGALGLQWTDDDRLVLVILDQRPWEVLRTRPDHRIRVDSMEREGQRARSASLDDVVGLHWEDAGSLLLARSEEGTGELLRLRDGTLRELVRAPLAGQVAFLPVGRNHLVRFGNPGGPDRAWILDDESAHAVSVETPASPDAPYGIVEGRLIGGFVKGTVIGERALAEAMEAAAGVPPTDHPGVRYVVPEGTVWSPDSVTFAEAFRCEKRSRTLWAHDRASGKWTPILEASPPGDRVGCDGQRPPKRRLVTTDYHSTLRLGGVRTHPSGAFVWRDGTGEPRVRAFLPGEGVLVDVAFTEGSVGDLRVEGVSGTDDPVVAWREEGDGCRMRFFRLMLDQAPVESLSDYPCSPGDVGRALYADDTGRLIAYVGGSVLLQGPGRESRTLWVPEGSREDPRSAP